MAQTALSAGYTPEQWKMATPLQIAGVGNGTQACNWETRLPICIADSEGNSESVHHFETPTVEGAGEDLPALLGLKSISGKQGVLETAPGKERLSFPGPGGYEIQWSPGTEHFMLKSAPSGHLVIPLGKFENVSDQQGGIPKAILQGPIAILQGEYNPNHNRKYLIPNIWNRQLYIWNRQPKTQRLICPKSKY